MKSLISPIIHVHVCICSASACYMYNLFYCVHVRILPKYDKYVFFIVHKPPSPHVIWNMFTLQCTNPLPNIYQDFIVRVHTISPICGIGFYYVHTTFPICGIGFYCVHTIFLISYISFLLCTYMYHLPNMWCRFLLCTYPLPNM